MLQICYGQIIAYSYVLVNPLIKNLFQSQLDRLLFTPMVFTVTNPAYLKLPYGKRPDSDPNTVLACDRAVHGPEINSSFNSHGSHLDFAFTAKLNRYSSYTIKQYITIK